MTVEKVKFGIFPMTAIQIYENKGLRINFTQESYFKIFLWGRGASIFFFFFGGDNFPHRIKARFYSYYYFF